MLLEQNLSPSGNPLLETAWATMEAANDLRDDAIVDICRRVIDTILRGDSPSKSDTDVIFNFFE
jgi:hypothetical protein